jgi:hypothetical protein
MTSTHCQSVALGRVLLADIGAAPARITDAALSAPRCRGKAHGFRSA